MGRTYKRNDTYRSNRPKSLREKRSTRSRTKYDQFNDTYRGESNNRTSTKQHTDNNDFDGDVFNG